jgi:hypothetical protein
MRRRRTTMMWAVWTRTAIANCISLGPAELASVCMSANVVKT